MERPDIDLYFMRMARLVATRSTCLRRAVGCVLVDDRNAVLATGYNGVARGEPHCNEALIITSNSWPTFPHSCPGAQSPSGTNLEGCRAVHAEQNALLQCRAPHEIRSIYVTTAPCDSCLKLFLNTDAVRLIVGGWYARPDGASNEVHVVRTWRESSPEAFRRSVIVELRT